MNFLAPLFLLGGLAIALPIVFHLIRRTTRERVVFSTLMFLQPSPPRLTRKSRLEHILLLVLRCLVVCLLALAFARPFFQKPMAAAPATEDARRLVVLLDTSASMRREGVWAEARRRAEAVIERARPGDQVAVLAFDRGTRTLLGFDEWAGMGIGDRRAFAAQRLSTVQPTWAATELDHALLAAVEAFESAETAETNLGARRIVVVSDLQEGSQLSALQGFEWPRGIEVDFQVVKPRRRTNAGVQVLAQTEEAAPAPGDSGTIYRVRVTNAADSQREQFQLAWADAAGSPIAGAPVVQAYVPPGQSRVFLMPEPTSESSSLRAPWGDRPARVVLSGDEEDFDNTAWVVRAPAEPVPVLFSGRAAETDPAELLFYLKRAFQQTRHHVVQLLVHPPESSLASPPSNATKLVVVTDPLPAEQLRALQPLLSAGATVLAVMKSPALAATIAGLVGVGTLPAEEAPVPDYAMFGQLDFEHPLLAPFADPRFSDFTKIHFWKHRRVNADALPGARVVARFDDGDPALIEVPVGQGTLFVLASSWRPVDSQLARSSKFVPLLYSLLELSGAIRARHTQYVVGDPLEWPRALAGPAAQVRQPDGTEVPLAAGQTRFAHTDQPGIYEIVGADPPTRFAVNLAPAESRTAPLSADALERLGVPLRDESVHAAKRAEERRRQLHVSELENRQKLWRWLIVAAVLGLMAETWLAGWLNRRATIQLQPEATP